jgi:glutamyl-tRNA reductase
MTLLVLGLSHRTAPVGVLEQVAVSVREAEEVLEQLIGCEHVIEALLLSTCNRVEVYAEVEAFHGGLAEITGVLERRSAISLDDLAGHLHVHFAQAAVEHLFSVAAGLDSMVLGEPQILGQLRTAYARAEQAGTLGSALHEVVQQALRVGRRVRAETGISDAGPSVVSEALAAATAVLTGGHGTGLAGRRALLIGTGTMGGLAAAQLRRAGVSEIVVANRTEPAAQRLAALCIAAGTPARAVGLPGVTATLPGVDVVVCCTGAREAVLGVDQLAGRRGPLVVCDLGLPRNVEPEVADVPGVTLVDLTAVARRAERHESGPGLVERARHVVAREVGDHFATRRVAEVAPTVSALRRRAAEVVQAELLRLDGRLPGLEGAVREELARTVHRVVGKLLHSPTVRVKQLAESGAAETYADALRELFELDPQAPTSIADVARISAPTR